MTARDWRELWRTDDLTEARAVSTTIHSMEFDARLIGRDGREVEAEASEEGGPFRVHVRGEDWPELAEVVDEIVAEQAEFDAHLDGWHRLSDRLHRLLLLVLTAIVAVLAVLGVIEL